MAAFGYGLLVDRVTLDAALDFPRQGNLTAAYAVLARAGDNCAANAQLIVDQNKSDFLTTVVRSVWANNAPGYASARTGNIR